MSTVILRKTRTQSPTPSSAPASSLSHNTLSSSVTSLGSAPVTPAGVSITATSYSTSKVGNVPLLKLFPAEYLLPKSLSTSSSSSVPTYVNASSDSSEATKSVASISNIPPCTPTKETHAGMLSIPTSIDSVNSGISQTTPPSPLLRKKSGELVKSSLKLPSLGKSMSTTNIPNRDKSVRFALRLANIKMFDGRESPVTVSNECTPLGSPKQLDDELYQPKRRSKLTFTWGSDFDDDFDDDNLGFSSSRNTTSTFEDDDKNSSDEESNSPPKYFIEHTDVLKNPQRIMSSPVYLQLIKLNEAANTLVGEILAKNIAFEKNLLLKLTFNNWTSNLTINLVSYVKSFGNSDLFRFEIPLMGLSKYLKLELVVRYDVAGQTYWDNNDNKNYHITLKPQPKPKSQAESSASSSGSGTLRMKSVSQLLDSGELFERLDRLQFSSTNNKSSSSGIPIKLKGKYSFEDSFSNPEPAPLMRSYLETNFSSTGTRYSQAYKNKKGYNDLLNSYCFYKSDKTTSASQESPSTASSGVKNAFTVSSANASPISASESALSKSPSGLNSASSTDYFGFNCHTSVGSAFHSFSDSVHV